MSALILQFDKGFLNSINSVDARLTAVLPPPRGREIHLCHSAKISKRKRIKRIESLHNSFVKEFTVMGVIKQRTNSFHLIPFIAFTQCLLLTYSYEQFYNTCVNAISQEGE